MGRWLTITKMDKSNKMRMSFCFKWKIKDKNISDNLWRVIDYENERWRLFHGRSLRFLIVI